MAALARPRRSFVGDEVLLRLRFHDVPQRVESGEGLDVVVGLTDEHMDDVEAFESPIASRWQEVVASVDVACVAVDAQGAGTVVALSRVGSRWRGRCGAGCREIRARATGTALRPLDVLPTAIEIAADGATAVVRECAFATGLALRVPEVYGRGTCRNVWNGGVVLAAYLADAKKRRGLEGRTVVDLGSGTGIVGYAAASLGARAFLTDKADSLDGLRALAARAPPTLALDVEALSFGDAPSDALKAASPTIAFAADVLYLSFDVVPLLWRTVTALPSLEELFVAFSHRDESSAQVLQLLMDCLKATFPKVSVGSRVENLASHHSVIRFKRA